MEDVKKYQKIFKKLVAAAKTTAKTKHRVKKYGSDFEVEFVSRAKMISLNSRYRNQPKDTDVLSFPAPKEFLGFLGVLVISKSKAKSQSKEYGHKFEDEVALLITHGFLHLIGFDHEKSKKEHAMMLKIEKTLLIKMGFDLPSLIERA